MRGDDDARHAELLRQPARVERSRAPVGDQREAPEVVAALHGDQADRAAHGGVRDLEDARRRLAQSQPERPRHGLERRPRAPGIHADHLAEQRVPPERPAAACASVTVASVPPRP